MARYYDFTSTNNRFKVGTKNGTAYKFDTANLVDFKAKAANVYVFDPVRGNNKVYVGDAADVDFDTKMVDATGAIKDKSGATLANNGAEALGLLDFVAAYEYDGDVLDVVIYKAYDFGRISY